MRDNSAWSSTVGSQYPTQSTWGRDPAGGYVEMLKSRNSARVHLIAWSEKHTMQEYLKELTEDSNLNRKEYGTVMSSEANEIGLENLLEIS